MEERFADKYSINNYFDKDDADSLLVNIVTFIGKKPKAATSKTRFNPEHREHFQNIASQFKFCYYHIDADSTHYYYIIRPARSIHGNLRAVGGFFNLNDDFRPVEFEETFVTPINEENVLENIGKSLFMELIKYKNVDKFLNDSTYIEWPDKRLTYCTENHEWRYLD